MAATIKEGDGQGQEEKKGDFIKRIPWTDLFPVTKKILPDGEEFLVYTQTGTPVRRDRPNGNPRNPQAKG